jgi:calcium-dependent protein kinase
LKELFELLDHNHDGVISI